MKIAGVDFPEPLLDALHGGRLVVFAGAGVSMGPPAGLPDFPELARQVAEGTGRTRRTSEAEDQFLGRLKAAGVEVHRITAQLLQKNSPQPTELHRSLLRLYTTSEDARIVTTNFDLLFEQAAGDVFDTAPRVFEAPTLPQGRRTQGIVHIHGSVNEPEEMVLTTEDFGRAYLTDAEGWARRFLVDLFTNRTVLFVGYSHNDTIMRYLTPSLPRENTVLLYALIGAQSDTPERWLDLGIQPTTFPQTDKSDYKGLDRAVRGLANHMSYSLLDWQQEITAIASGSPLDIDDESAGIIEQALADPVTTRFFVDVAESPEWIDWLDRRGHLNALFADRDISEQDWRLSRWLVSRFAMEHDSSLFALLQRHGGQLNPLFWQDFCWQIQDSTRQSPDAAVMTRWVLFLASVIPANANEIALSWVAESCARIGAMDSLLRVYEAMTAQINRAPPISSWGSSDMYHYEMQSILTDCITPNLPTIAESALEITSMRLSERHAMLMAWQEGDATWDSDDFSRSAIEPHKQDDFPRNIDALINTARECLEWLAANRPDMARLWSERYVSSHAPLLRRLAIHAMSARTDLSADDKIAWLLERCDIHETAARHEIFRVAGIAYPQTGQEIRQELIKAVMTYQAPLEDELERERRSAYSRFNWLHWLQEADPDCTLTKQVVSEILEQYPEFMPREHPDLTYWFSGLHQVEGKPSKWSVEEMLAQSAVEFLGAALDQQPSEYLLDPRDRLIDNIAKATEQKPGWGIALAEQMSLAEEWDTHIWRGIIEGWCSAELDEDNLTNAIKLLSVMQIYDVHGADIADAIGKLIGKNQASVSMTTLELANSAARNLWGYIPTVDPMNESDWMTRAINHQSGEIARFWLQSISIWKSQQEPVPTVLSTEYREGLSEIIEDQRMPGQLARVVFMSQFPFLAFTDEEWAIHHLLPLLASGHNEFVSAWDGLTYCGQMTPRAAELLREPLLGAVEHISRELGGGLQRRFLRYYTAMLTWFATGPDDEWIVKLFSNGDADVKQGFAEQIGYRLRSLDEAQQQEWWNVWLKGYWENRLLGIPAPLDDDEIRTMLGWTNHLPAIYSEAVDLAVRMPIVPLERGFFIRELGKSDLAGKHPAATAKLLVHLGQADHSPWFWHGTRKLFDRLLESDLDTAIKVALRETMAKIGFFD